MDVAIALGGGGARGNAHIGVLRRLLAEGFKIRAVAGTSAGGIAAAAFAAGYTPDEMEAIFASVDQTKLFARLSAEGPGLLGLSGARKILEEFLGERTFADLKIPCAMVAVDLEGAKEIVIQEGRVVDAVLATIAIPGVFPPKESGGYRLVDGGVLNPVPVSVARSLAPGLPVLAVVLSPSMEQPRHLSHIPLPIKVPAPIIERFTQLRFAQAFNIFMDSVDVGQRMITELRLQVDEPDVVIRPDVGDIGLLDRVDVHKIVRLGEKAVDRVLPQIQRTVSWKNNMRRRMFPRKRRKAGQREA
jgi:NTE family protein